MISHLNCIGCQACVDICPVNTITFEYNNWGEGRAFVNKNNCINCGLCDKVCPANNISLNEVVDSVLAVKSKVNLKKGSSGGVFYELAKVFIEEGGIVYGAAFNSELKLIHTKATNILELEKLCKSKYIHSDMSGIYAEIKEYLKIGKKIMFVGTPCQTSAVKNLFGEKYSEQIYLFDFLCHGTGTQKVFDLCIKNVEEIKQGKIIDFTFRSKSRKAEHSFTYKFKKRSKTKQVSGYGFEFPYYHSYLTYTIFDDACYQCKYARNQRVGDITFGDFWGIQNYNKKLKDYKGVSMIALNTTKGASFFDKIKDKVECCSYPLAYATSKNQSFNEPEAYPKRKKELVDLLEVKGEASLVEELGCKNPIKMLLYFKIPNWIKKLYNKFRGKK